MIIIFAVPGREPLFNEALAEMSTFESAHPSADPCPMTPLHMTR